MKLKDLKDGMIVETRKRRRYVVDGDFFIGTDSKLKRRHYNEDMTDKTMKQFDIVRVLKQVGPVYEDIYKDVFVATIWEAEEKYLTIEECLDIGKPFHHKDYNVYTTGLIEVIEDIHDLLVSRGLSENEANKELLRIINSREFSVPIGIKDRVLNGTKKEEL